MKASKEMQRMILSVVNAENYKPVKAAGIAKKLKLKKDGDVRELRRAIKVLVKDNKLTYGSKHIILPAGSSTGRKRKGNELSGIYRRTSSGFGFVTPDGSIATDRSDDIYVAAKKAADAADGDRVLIRVSKRKVGRETRTSGKVLDVLERRTNRFVGTYRERGGFGMVTIDNGTFESAILVGDASARNCRVGDKVVIEMAQFPSPTREGEGVVVEVLGERGAPGVDTQMIIHEFGLPGEFPEAVLESAREQAEKFDESIPEGRVDFTDTTVITIDPKTARDFDDAISLERLENGHWKLGVHIADVSHFVPYRSDVDNEAFRRGTSVYLPDRVIPMLPELISNNLASLQPHRVRYTMTALIEFTAEGAPVATDLHRGAIKSAHRFNYEEIDDYLADDKPWKKKLTPEVFELVRNMHTLAMMLRRRRMDRGSIDLTLPDVRIDLDEDGKVSGAHAEEHTESHQVIEEFMLAANEAVARRMVDEKLYLIRRVHEAPSESKLKELTRFVGQLGIKTGNLQDRFEIKRVVAESNGMPQQHAIHFSILRAMQKAVYSPRELGHYALASDAYCHFTSPIRRYPDLIIHRAIGDLIDGKRPDTDFNRLASLGNHCSDLERRAEKAERELIKLKLLNFLVDKVGMEMQAVVTGVEAFGLFAQGVELPAEGLIPLENLPADRYFFDKPSRSLAGHRPGNQFRLGDLVSIRVAHVDPDSRELEFEFLDRSKRKHKNNDTGGRKAGRSNKSSSGRGSKKGAAGSRSSVKARKTAGSSQAESSSEKAIPATKKWKPQIGPTGREAVKKKREAGKKKPLGETTPKKKPGKSRSSRKKKAAKKAKKVARKKARAANKKSAKKKSAHKNSAHKKSAKSAGKKKATPKKSTNRKSKNSKTRNSKAKNSKTGKKKSATRKKSGKRTSKK